MDSVFSPRSNGTKPERYGRKRRRKRKRCLMVDNVNKLTTRAQRTQKISVFGPVFPVIFEPSLRPYFLRELFIAALSSGELFSSLVVSE
jgi:hypothetical protein